MWFQTTITAIGLISYEPDARVLPVLFSLIIIIIIISDSDTSAKREIAYFFPNFNPELWFREEEEYFRNNQIGFDEEKCEHILEKGWLCG